jgi:hypothetical protein
MAANPTDEVLARCAPPLGLNNFFLPCVVGADRALMRGRAGLYSRGDRLGCEGGQAGFQHVPVGRSVSSLAARATDPNGEVGIATVLSPAVQGKLAAWSQCGAHWWLAATWR